MNTLFDDGLSNTTPREPVTCLGRTFPDDDARRGYFRELLRQKLKDPDFRKIEGFPLGEDEDILALSDPPYYTACPNPWIADFIAEWEAQKPAAPEGEVYHREPLAVDVSVGKSDALYKAHSYHTKVPHLAIVPSILHYTRPGDVVLDGFCGSGMTGVAAQWCGLAPAAYRHELEAAWKKDGRVAPQWGARTAVLNDLSPAATFIAANYTTPFDVEAFAAAGRALLEEVERDIGWMYETLHTDGKTKGRIEYTVWSEVFGCPECGGTLNFLDEALEDDSKRVRDTFPCPHCGANLNKDTLQRVLETRVDPATGESWQRVKYLPSIISYVVGRNRYEKQPDEADLALLEKIEALPFPAATPTKRFPIEAMYHGSRIGPKGFTHVHHFYLPRALQAMGTLWAKANAHPDARIRAFLLFLVEQGIGTMSVLNRYRANQTSQSNQILSGVYYVPSQVAEISVSYRFDKKLEQLANTFREMKLSNGGAAIISTGSAAALPVPDNTVDYIFTDPPFGENIYYADLNFLVEAWYGVLTDAGPEAIIDRFKEKGLPEYQRLMQRCFAEYLRVLKPGRWMTVVFSNSRASVWNAIQVGLQRAGFVVAEVSALDKVQGSYRQVTSTTAVKQDLVISAYKPNGGLEDRFAARGASAESAWDFVKTHLGNLPVTKGKEGMLEFVVERDPRRVFDRMVAWFVRHDAFVPLSSDEFLSALRGRFPERDGMVFLPEQVGEYDRKRLLLAQAPQMELFVDDERSAIDWLTDFLKKRPCTYQEIHPDFIRQLGAGWKKHEAAPELSLLLNQNFLCYDGKGPVPEQIHAYLSSNFKDLRNLAKDDPALVAKAEDRWYVPDPNKAADLEKLRERTLLRVFEDYKAAVRRLKVVRLEAVRAGFKKAWQEKDYALIARVADILPRDAVEEDSKLLMWWDQAKTRLEQEREGRR